MADITWLNNLKEQVIEEKDKTNFDDLIKCYQNDLLRAGFVMAWLMLVESLKRKIVTLADKEVKVAKEALTTITGTEEAMHSNDEVIWKGAVKCDLITKEEESVVEMLWQKRCLMSHPYMPEVSESDFRYMVENLVSMSLGKTVMWSKPMIEAFFADIKANVFLIPDEVEEKQDLADRILSLIPAKLFPFFWKTLFYELSLCLESGHKKHRMMLRIMAARFVRMPSVNINDTQFALANQIKNYCGVCWNVFSNKRAWRKLDGEYQAQMFRFLKDNKKEAKKVLCLAKALIENEDSLDEKYIDDYYEALADYDVTDMQGYYLDKNRFIELLYEEKIKGYQFGDQGDFIDMLSSMTQNEINDYTPTQLQQIGKFVEICCVTGTFKAQYFVSTHNVWSENLNFAKGVAFEGLSNDDGELYLSKKHMEYVLPVLYHTGEKNQMAVINSINKIPVKETVKDTMLNKMLHNEIKKYFEETSETGKALMAVVDKYCNA